MSGESKEEKERQRQRLQEEYRRARGEMARAVVSSLSDMPLGQGEDGDRDDADGAAMDFIGADTAVYEDSREKAQGIARSTASWVSRTSGAMVDFATGSCAQLPPTVCMLLKLGMGMYMSALTVQFGRIYAYSFDTAEEFIDIGSEVIVADAMTIARLPGELTKILLSEALSSQVVLEMLGKTIDEMSDTLNYLVDQLMGMGVAYFAEYFENTEIEIDGAVVPPERKREVTKIVAKLSNVSPGNLADGILQLKSTPNVVDPDTPVVQQMLDFQARHRHDDFDDYLKDEMARQTLGGMKEAADKILEGITPEVTEGASPSQVVLHVVDEVVKLPSFDTMVLYGPAPNLYIAANVVSRLPRVIPLFPANVARRMARHLMMAGHDIEGKHYTAAVKMDTLSRAFVEDFPWQPTFALPVYGRSEGSASTTLRPYQFDPFEQHYARQLQRYTQASDVFNSVMVIVIWFRLIRWVWQSVQRALSDIPSVEYKAGRFVRRSRAGKGTQGELVHIGGAMAEFLNTPPPETADPRVMHAYLARVTALFSRAMNETDDLIRRDAFPQSWTPQDVGESRTGWAVFDGRQGEFDRPVAVGIFKTVTDPDALERANARMYNAADVAGFPSRAQFYAHIRSILPDRFLPLSMDVHMVHLRLADCNLGAEGVVEVIRAAARSTVLETLDLSGNVRTASAHVNRALGVLIKAARALRFLAFDRNVLMPDPFTTAEVLRMPLLSDEEGEGEGEGEYIRGAYGAQASIAEEYIQALADGIEDQGATDSQSRLVDIHLAGVQLNLPALDMLAVALVRNQRLEVFDFSDAPGYVLSEEHRLKGRYAYIDLQRFVRANRHGVRNLKADLAQYDPLAANLELAMENQDAIESLRAEFAAEALEFYGTVRSKHLAIFEAMRSFMRTPDADHPPADPPAYPPARTEERADEPIVDALVAPMLVVDDYDGGGGASETEQWGWTWAQFYAWFNALPSGYGQRSYFAYIEANFPGYDERLEIDPPPPEFVHEVRRPKRVRIQARYLNAAFHDAPHITVNAARARFAEGIIDNTLARWEASVGDPEALSAHDQARYDLVDRFLRATESFGRLD